MQCSSRSRYFWCEQATSYWETLFGLPEFCGCWPAYICPAVPLGLKAEPRALFWWEIFASLKGLAIWISAAREYGDGRNTDPVNLFSGWYCTAFHNKVLADRLSAVGA